MRPKPDRDDPDRAGVLGREDLITRLRREVAIRDSKLADLRVRLDAAEHELEDLRAIRDALTPFDLPVNRPGELGGFDLTREKWSRGSGMLRQRGLPRCHVITARRSVAR
jgi:hypothetical protein